MTQKKQNKFQKLIDQLEYAKRLHIDELEDRIKEQKQVPKDKDFVVKTLQEIEINGKTLAKRVEKSINLVREWQDSHYLWIDLVRQNKKWASYGGNISWQKKWIKIYGDILKILESVSK